jgi:hypothetical protein
MHFMCSVNIRKKHTNQYMTMHLPRYIYVRRLLKQQHVKHPLQTRIPAFC